MIILEIYCSLFFSFTFFLNVVHHWGIMIYFVVYVTEVNNRWMDIIIFCHGQRRMFFVINSVVWWAKLELLGHREAFYILKHHPYIQACFSPNGPGNPVAYKWHHEKRATSQSEAKHQINCSRTLHGDTIDNRIEA